MTRGCTKDLEKSDYELVLNAIQRSSLCLEDDCNDQAVKVYPYCYECDSETDPKCVSQMDKSMLKICPYSEEDLRCFHMIGGN